MDEEARRELSVPFGTAWYKCESCTLGKKKGEWVFHFGGKLKEYTPRFETYRDFRKLALANPEPSDLPNRKYAWERKPDDSVLEFLQNWGPLGIWHSRTSAFFRDNDTDMVLYRQPWIGLRLMSFQDYWMQNHTRKLPSYDSPKMFRRGTWSLEPGMVFDNYYETWRDVEHELKALQLVCKLYDETKLQREIKYTPEKIVEFFNALMRHSALHPRLIPRDDNKGHKWSYAFSSLYEALVALHGQNIIGEVDMRECKNCGRPFDAIETGRPTFCTSRCLAEYPDKQKREDPVIKYRRMLQRRLERRYEDEVSKERSQSINAELLQAKSVKELKNIEEKKYPLILRNKKGSAK